jgi:hypothetical protein
MNSLPDRTQSSVKQLVAANLRCDCNILSSALMSEAECGYEKANTCMSYLHVIHNWILTVLLRNWQSCRTQFKNTWSFISTSLPHICGMMLVHREKCLSWIICLQWTIHHRKEHARYPDRIRNIFKRAKQRFSKGLSEIYFIYTTFWKLEPFPSSGICGSSRRKQSHLLTTKEVLSVVCILLSPNIIIMR